MTQTTRDLRLPDYDSFNESIAVLDLPISVSELHGTLCGYLCADASDQGEIYLRSLFNNKKDEAAREAFLAIFSVFSISQQQIKNFDFEFDMLLPDDNEPLSYRAQAFSQWCEGFTQGLTCAGIEPDQFDEEEAQEALQHMIEFAELDYEHIDVTEEDEQAFMEVSEYARMAVIRLHGDLILQERRENKPDTTH